MEPNNKKQIFIAIITVTILVISVIGVTYAFFNYTRTGNANTVRVGRIYFNHEEGDSISLQNVFPISSEQAETDTVNAKTLSITVVGDTDYDKGIEYLLTLDSVNNTVNNKKVPINLEVSVTGEGLGTEEQNNYYTNRDTYTESKYKIEYNGKLVNGKHLLVGFISPNTTKGTIEGINGTINIKAYIDKDKVLISDTYPEGIVTIGGVEYYNGTPTTNKLVLTTEEWNSITGNNALSFKIKVEAREGIWVTDKPVNNCTFDVSTINVTTYDINIDQCKSMVSSYLFGISTADANTFCTGGEIEFNGTNVDFEAGISSLGMTLEDAEQQGLISNLQTGPATELVKGIEYVNGQYTYSYNNNGWIMRLTDKNSTDPVTTKMCTKVNNYPITSMQATFMNSNATSIDLSSFDTSNVTDMSGMFRSAAATSLDLSNFDTRNVTIMAAMFEFSQATNLDLSNFDTSNVTNMRYMFGNSQATSLDLSSFDTRNVTTMEGMFAHSSVISLDLSSFDTRNVTNMADMFSESQATSLDLSSFDTSNVTNMEWMFGNCDVAKVYVSNLWNTNNVTDYFGIFTGAYNLVGGYTENPTTNDGRDYDISYARIDGGPTSPGFFTYKEAPNN